ncbi:MAG: hypothetical protein JWQ90_3090 [Hydrocarboniphaga sp.]|uniref:sulfotransferase family protein n=1 Tax=Hydrocarboniphaga sp. TaxID=2033016 RepID=UPI0026390B8D|nr:sulfotransferase [Hydrocarboniphaga sp.]MDB5970640.1 hypothetical protein [Hydrocarboniphaga sp.]
MAGQRIDIADIRAPVLTQLQQQTLAWAQANPPLLTEDAVLGAAREATGLSDFGEEDFRPRLRLWLQALQEADNVTELGRLGPYLDMVRYAGNRLRIEDLVKRHPEILQIPIDRPIVIAGLPRSGTTYLQSFIAGDRRLRSMPFWEVTRPVPAPGEEPVPGQPDPRHTRSQQDYAQADALLPYIKSFHDFAPDHISEDIELQALDFSSYYLEWLVPSRRWQEHYFATDITSSYRYLKKGLQVMTWFKGPNRWLLKCPQHMEQLLPLRTVFPDATIVINHRDPVASIQSAITAIAYAARVRNQRVEPRVIADYWIARYEKLLRRCVRDRDQLEEAHSVDVYFDKLMADPWAAVGEIYAKAGLPLDAEVKANLEAAVAAHPRGKHGQIEYHLERDFGIRPAEMRERFAFYFERFPVPVEVL